MRGGPGGLLAGLTMAVVVGLATSLWTWTRPGDPTLHPPRASDAAVVVHLLDNGFHTDLTIPRGALEARSGPLGAAVRTLGPGDWVRVGWGDARFYVSTAPIRDRLPDGARAFLKPGNPSVVMLDPDPTDPARRPRDGRATLRLTPAGFDALARRIEASLALEGGVARLASSRPGDDARFFASGETFSILRLCNHWTAQVLNAAGIEVRPARAITSGEVMRVARKAARKTAVLDTAAAHD